MKHIRFLPFLLAVFLVLLPGCGREAKIPAPDWPERLTGEYDDALTFTFRGEAPAYTGVDSQTGRMTALFPTDGGFLVLNWRRLASAEIELMEDFLAGTGGETGVWDRSADPNSTLESYVRLDQRWYCLSASCGALGEAALLRLTDGAVEASAGSETALPRASSSLWLELLPWEEDWTCLLLGFWELDPAVGKEALRSLLTSYDWQLVEPRAEEAEFHPSIGIATVPLRYQTSIFTDPVRTRETKSIRFHLRTEEKGALYWNGALRRPVGDGAGESLLEAWTALSETGVNIQSPPQLTLSSGEASIPAIIYGTYSWSHISLIGDFFGAESDALDFTEIDWFGMEAPILKASGPVELHFGPVSLAGLPGEPDRKTLYEFSDGEEIPVELADGRFTPLPGLHSYALSCSWKRPDEEPGGSGYCRYVLLIDGPESPEEQNTDGGN